MAKFSRSVGLSTSSIVALAGLVMVSACRQRIADVPREIQPSYNKDTGRLERISYDRNHDQRPDAWLFMDGTRVLRAELDENYDGKVDRWEYYGATTANTSGATVKGFAPGGILERAEEATSDSGKVNRWES